MTLNEYLKQVRERSIGPGDISLLSELTGKMEYALKRISTSAHTADRREAEDCLFECEALIAKGNEK